VFSICVNVWFLLSHNLFPNAHGFQDMRERLGPSERSSRTSTRPGFCRLDLVAVDMLTPTWPNETIPSPPFLVEPPSFNDAAHIYTYTCTATYTIRTYTLAQNKISFSSNLRFGRKTNTFATLDGHTSSFNCALVKIFGEMATRLVFF